AGPWGSAASRAGSGGFPRSGRCPTGSTAGAGGAGMPPSLASVRPASRPRWYSHAYNRADFYRLAAAFGWLPRRARLALARRLGRLATRRMPAEREAVRSTLARVTGAEGSRLDGLTVATFTHFPMCFTHLVTTHSHPFHPLVS